MDWRCGVLGALCCATALAGPQGTVEKKAVTPERPPLAWKQGRYFAFAAPKDWVFHETTNGVDLVAPDGKTGVSNALLMGAFGQATPRGFLEQTLKSLGYADARILSVKEMDDIPGVMGLPWKVIEAELSFTYQGVKVRATAVCGVVQGAGQYCAIVSAYQAPEAAWEEARAWLPAVARSILITNPREVAGLDKIQLPRNNPLDDSTLRASWKAKGLSEDRISQARREGTMGYERMESPSTGKAFEMPLERYDGKIAGYRNPEKPEEILVKPKP